ncbi:MAG: transcriptional regulator [Thermofilum sp. ex4484_15]|nr:MAG: transcriptional regulator [Thermofilum sp. ex4484_15]
MGVPSVPRVWREIKYKYNLIGSKCVKCGKACYPPLTVCPYCGGKEVREVKLPERGKVISYTIIRYAPRGFEKLVPYVVALIELVDGTRLISQLTDVEPEEVSIGMEVEAVFRRLREQGNSGIIEYGLKFRPLRR